MLRGVDISNHNASYPNGEDFYILKATEGLTFTDTTFLPRWAALRGQRRWAYHFGHPATDARDQARRFLRLVSPVLGPGDIVVLDHEVSDGLSPEATAAWALTWCREVEALSGRRPVVYTFLSFAREGRCAGLGAYPLWIADPSSPAGRPRVPAPWSSWALHQYSSASGLDRDVLNGGDELWRELAQEGTDMPGYISLGLTKPMTAKGGQPTRIDWDREYADAENVHHDGRFPALVVAGAHGVAFTASVNTSVQLAPHMIAGDTPGTVRLVEVTAVKGKWEVTKSYPRHPLGESWTEVGRVSAHAHLWVQVEAATECLVNAASKTLYWN